MKDTMWTCLRDSMAFIGALFLVLMAAGVI